MTAVQVSAGVPPEIPSVHGHVIAELPPAERAADDTAATFAAHGPHTGSPWLELSVVDFAPGRSADRPADEREVLLFVVRGDGTLVVGDAEHPLEPETAALVPAGATWAVDHGGSGELRLVAVAVDPSRGQGAQEVALVRLAD